MTKLRYLIIIIFANALAYQSCLSNCKSVGKIETKDSLAEFSNHNSIRVSDSSNCSLIDTLGIHLLPDRQAKFGDSPYDFVNFISQLTLVLDEGNELNAPELTVNMKLIVSNFGEASILEVNGKNKLSYSEWEFALVKQFESSQMWRPASCQEENVSSYLHLTFRLRLN
jgi:hypothetical protein